MTATVKDPVGAQTLNIISEAHRFNEWMYNNIKPWLKGNILEIGSGIGNISRYVLRDFPSVSLSDYDSAYVSILQGKFAQHPSIKGFYSIDLQHKKFEETYPEHRQRYDSIFLLNVIEHLADDQAAVEHCAWMLKPGGNLVLLAPSYNWLFCRMDKELGHFRRYTTKTLSRVVESSGELQVTHRTYFNATGIAGWLIMGKWLNQAALRKNEMTAFNRIVPIAKLTDKIFARSIGLSSIVVGTKK